MRLRSTICALATPPGEGGIAVVRLSGPDAYAIGAKVFVPTIIPLVLSSITGTEERALTLEARGFSSGIRPTHLEDIEKTPADKTATVIITVLFIIAIAGRIALWVI